MDVIIYMITCHKNRKILNLKNKNSLSHNEYSTYNLSITIYRDNMHFTSYVLQAYVPTFTRKLIYIKKFLYCFNY